MAPHVTRQDVLPREARPAVLASERPIADVAADVPPRVRLQRAGVAAQFTEVKLPARPALPTPCKLHICFDRLWKKLELWKVKVKLLKWRSIHCENISSAKFQEILIPRRCASSYDPEIQKDMHQGCIGTWLEMRGHPQSFGNVATKWHISVMTHFHSFPKNGWERETIQDLYLKMSSMGHAAHASHHLPPSKANSHS